MDHLRELFETAIKAATDRVAEARKTGNVQKGEAQTDSGDVQHSINTSFSAEINAWSRDGRPDNELFVLGSTGPVLRGLGAIESDIYMMGDKIKEILSDHPEMSLSVIKKIPQLLEDPVLILSSKGTGKNNKNSRLVVYGSVKTSNGQPIMAVLDLRPVEDHLVVADMQKVSSSYTKKNPINLVTTSDVLHADKKRTIPLLRTMGLQLRPIDLLRSGSVGNIAYKGDFVNISGVPFSTVVRYSQQSTTQHSLKTPDAPVGQAISSAKTSIKQIPALFKHSGVEFGKTNIDIGGKGRSTARPLSVFVFMG